MDTLQHACESHAHFEHVRIARCTSRKSGRTTSKTRDMRPVKDIPLSKRLSHHRMAHTVSSSRDQLDCTPSRYEASPTDMGTILPHTPSIGPKTQQGNGSLDLFVLSGRYLPMLFYSHLRCFFAEPGFCEPWRGSYSHACPLLPKSPSRADRAVSTGRSQPIPQHRTRFSPPYLRHTSQPAT